MVLNDFSSEYNRFQKKTSLLGEPKGGFIDVRTGFGSCTNFEKVFTLVIPVLADPNI